MWCSCDNDVRAATRYGLFYVFNSSNPNAYCGQLGGPLCNAVYRSIDCSTASDVHSVSLGAYLDQETRAVPNPPMQYGYTVATCRATCLARNERIFTLQNFGWCACGTSMKRATQYGVTPWTYDKAAGVVCMPEGSWWCNSLHIAARCNVASDTVSASDMTTNSVAGPLVVEVSSPTSSSATPSPSSGSAPSSSSSGSSCPTTNERDHYWLSVVLGVAFGSSVVTLLLTLAVIHFCCRSSSNNLSKEEVANLANIPVVHQDFGFGVQQRNPRRSHSSRRQGAVVGNVVADLPRGYV